MLHNTSVLIKIDNRRKERERVGKGEINNNIPWHR
jgi:hypothetical protein